LPRPWENKSGLPDPTAYEATKPTEEEIRVGKLVKTFRTIADLWGFDIINRIEFRSKESGRRYR